MAFSDTNITKLYEIFGFPEGGEGVIITSLSHIPPSLSNSWEPTYTVGDMSTLKTRIDTSLTAAADNPTLKTQVEAWIAEYDTIGKGSVLHVTAAGGGAQGELVNDPQKIENIRQGIGNLIGLWIPKGGFWGATQRMMRRGKGDR